MLKGSDESTYDITTTTTISPDDIWTTTIYPQSDEEESTTWKEQITTDAEPDTKPSTILTRVEAQPIEVIRPENEVTKVKSDVVRKVVSGAEFKAELEAQSKESEIQSEEISRPTEAPQAKEIDSDNINGEKAENHELENKYNQMQTENSQNTENEIKALSAETSSNVLQMAGGNLDNKMIHLETHDQDSKTNNDEGTVNKSEVGETSADYSTSISTSKSESYHPKNHRSEWSEVKYPSDRSLYDFAKYGTWNYKNLTKELKETEENSDENKKHLSDYVKAIFDSIKSADAEQGDEQNFTDPPQIGTGETTLDSVADESTQSHVINTDMISSDSSKVEVVTAGGKDSATSETTVVSESVPKQKTSLESETSVKTESSTKSEPTSKSDLTPKSELPSQSEELNPGVTKLGKVLRTSTTTRVSHMTEICFRGRCVMSRPRVEGHAR